MTEGERRYASAMQRANVQKGGHIDITVLTHPNTQPVNLALSIMRKTACKSCVFREMIH